MAYDSNRRRIVFIGAALLAGCGGRDPFVDQQDGLQYRVQAGDTLAGLARRSGLSVNTICRVNGLRSTQLQVGQPLWLPGVRQLRMEQHDYLDLQPTHAPAHQHLIVERQAWHAQAMRANHDPMPFINRITIHHTAMGASDHLGDDDFIRMVQDRHQRKGWADIGYHYILGFDGRIFRGRPEHIQGAHVGGDANKFNLGIALRGNFMRHMPTPKQMATLQRLLPERQSRHGVGTGQVFGHRDIGSTLCPGDQLYAWLQRFKHHRV